MYTISIEGKTLEDLKKNINDLNDELHTRIDYVPTPLDTALKDVMVANDTTSKEVPTTPTVLFDPPPVPEPVERPDMEAVVMDTDSSGAEWDENIHSSSRAKTTKGLWKKRKGGPKTIKAEPSKGVPTLYEDIPGTVRPPAPVVPAPLPPAPAATGYDHFSANFIDVLGELVNTEKITREYVKSLCEYFEVAAIWNVQDDEKKLKELYSNFQDAGLL